MLSGGMNVQEAEAALQDCKGNLTNAKGTIDHAKQTQSHGTGTAAVAAAEAAVAAAEAAVAAAQAAVPATADKATNISTENEEAVNKAKRAVEAAREAAREAEEKAQPDVAAVEAAREEAGADEEKAEPDGAAKKPISVSSSAVSSSAQARQGTGLDVAGVNTSVLRRQLLHSNPYDARNGNNIPIIQTEYLFEQIKSEIEKNKSTGIGNVDFTENTIEKIIGILETNLGKTKEELQKKESEIKKILQTEDSADDKATKIINVFFLNGYSREQLAMGMGVAGLTTGIVGYTFGKKHGKKSKH
jgi:hypothetical protein